MWAVGGLVMVELNPHGVPGEHDVIMTPPGDVPGWSQNIQFSCHLGEQGGGLWVHASSIGDQAPPLWEMVFTLLLPGEDGKEAVLHARTFGRPSDPSIASSGPHTLTVEEPLRRWRMRFDGVARRVDPREALTAPVPEGAVEPLTADLVIEAHGPIWSLEGAGGRMDAQDWAKLHTEQAVRVHGTIGTVDGELTVDHIGIRDVSAGARDFSSLLGHTWASCAFPDGRFIGAYQVRSSGGRPGIEHGMLWDGSTLHDIGNIRTGALTSPAGDPRRNVITFDGPDGPCSVRVEVQQSMIYSLSREGRIIAGVDLASYNLFDIEATAVFEWDGMRGLGWIERSARAGELGLG
jgi:hypothetical protein